MLLLSSSSLVVSGCLDSSAGCMGGASARGGMSASSAWALMPAALLGVVVTICKRTIAVETAVGAD